MFGQTSKPSTGFGGFGSSNSSTGGGLFGAKPAAGGAAGELFGQPAQQQNASGGLFGSKPSTGMFGQSSTGATSGAGGGLFGSNTQQQQPSQGAGLFGNQQTQQPGSTTGGLFGQQQQPSTSGGGLFGGAQASKPATGNLFGSSNTGGTTSGGGLFGGGASGTGATSGTSGGGLFGSKPSAPSGGLFGASTAQPSGGLFGGNTSTTTNASQPGGGLFGSNTGGLFGNKPATSEGLFGQPQFQQQHQQQQHHPQSQQQPQLSAMTRVGDLPPEIKNELQQLDTYISTQHLIATTLNSDMPKHNELIETIPKDISYLQNKLLSTKQALKFDSNQLQSLKDMNNEITDDINNILQLIIQLSTPGTKLSSSYQLNEFFIKKIKKYYEVTQLYEETIRELEVVLDGLERSCNEGFGNLANIVQVIKTQYALFMDLCEQMAQLHIEVKRL
ncbi:uncharacterized protein LODBEIA_P15060 [Lodderomyces beijingensis]|uniref:Nucleoporin Nup54 alpha-helical domain-containing protein n=1 Tax=Lodderomyces beijingensis TaxID=1775926 RepID=A0ABP0ZIK6_9ASCO